MTRRKSALLTSAVILFCCCSGALPSPESRGEDTRFTSVPDLFNWNISNPQPGWEDTLDWFFDRLQQDGPDFTLNAGDIMDARWWDDETQVKRKTEEYWTGFKKRFDDRNLNYLRGSVCPKKMTLELLEFDVEYGGGYIGDHPHRGAKNRPKENVTLAASTKRDGPRVTGTLVLTVGSNGSVEATRIEGWFAKKEAGE